MRDESCEDKKVEEGFEIGGVLRKSPVLAALTPHFLAWKCARLGEFRNEYEKMDDAGQRETGGFFDK